jgi:small nuclear ribonucleoprotein (snRNP)-like protein
LRSNSVMHVEPSRKPLNLLVKKLNAEISIRLKNDVEYHGKMIDADSHMNIILEGATEYRGNSPTANYGNIILRGSNILYISVEAGKKQA